MFRYEIIYNPEYNDPYMPDPRPAQPNMPTIVEASGFNLIFNEEGPHRRLVGLEFYDNDKNTVAALFQLPRMVKILDGTPT